MVFGILALMVLILGDCAFKDFDIQALERFYVLSMLVVRIVVLGVWISRVS